MSVFVDRRQAMYPKGFFCGVIRLKQLAGVILGRLDSNTRQLLSALIGLVFGNCCYYGLLKAVRAQATSICFCLLDSRFQKTL